MKKNLIAALGVLLIAGATMGQELRLNGYGGYVFDDRVEAWASNTSYYEGTIKGGFLWGAGLEFMVQQAYGIELLYMRQDTKIPMTYYDLLVKNEEFDLAMNWIMLGGVRYMINNPKFHPYGGILLGAAFGTVTNPENNRESSATKFAWGLRLGVNINAAERFGIKLQTQIMSAVQGAGGSFYFGTGGAGAGLSTYSTMLQFGLGGGVFFRFGPGVTGPKK